MKIKPYSFRYAEEILAHPSNEDAARDLSYVVENLPLFLHSGKGSKKPDLDVDQWCMNAYFDRLFAVEKKWEFHPLATKIEESGLAADFKKKFSNIRIQAEVQFGNASRVYADVFKFQAAFSQDEIDLGVCIIPVSSLAKRIGENIVSFERVTKELRAARSFLTLPILVLGIEPTETTKIVDIRQSGLPVTKDGKVKLTGNNAYRIANAVFEGRPIASVTEAIPAEPIPKAKSPLTPEDKAERGNA